MRDMNSVNITGNICSDPTLKATASGTDVLNFRIASNYSVKDKQTGEWKDRANFVSITVMGARAEPLSRFLGKGDKVAVSGSLRYHSWESDDGNKHSMLEVMGDNVILMSKKNHSQTPQEPQNATQTHDDLYDYDCPF